jgi:hypothetical protein
MRTFVAARRPVFDLHGDRMLIYACQGYGNSVSFLTSLTPRYPFFDFLVSEDPHSILGEYVAEPGPDGGSGNEIPVH